MTTSAILLLGKVLKSPMKKTILVHVPKMKMDQRYFMYYRENDEYYVHDPEEISKPGDIVIIKELPEHISLKVKHSLEKVVYQLGNIIDPITGRQCLGTEFVTDVHHISKLMGQKPRHLTESQMDEEATVAKDAR